MGLAILACPDISGYVSEHARPIMSLGDSGYGFGYAEVAGGRCVVVTTKDLDALLGWHAQLPT